MNIIEVTKLSKKFPINGGELEVLKIEQLSIPQGKMIYILGHSGSGKSTLLEILAGIQEKTSGKIIFSNSDKKLDYDNFSLNKDLVIDYLKHHIAFSFQSSNLLSYYTVQENIEFPNLNNNIQTGYESEPQRYHLYEHLEIEAILDKHIATISGGQKQRVSLARATIKNFDIFFADEPTGSVGPRHEDPILSYIKETIIRKNNKTAVIASHNIKKAIKYADLIIIIKKSDDDSPGLINASSSFELIDNDFCSKDKKYKISKDNVQELEEIIIRKLNGDD